MRVTTSEVHSMARIYTPLMQTYLVGVKEEEEEERSGRGRLEEEQWRRRSGRGGVGEEDGKRKSGGGG